MKMSWTVASLALVALFGAAPDSFGQQAGVTAEKAPGKGTITTGGVATLKVKPDAVRVSFGVQTVGKTVKAAREENGERCKKLIAALAALKVPDLKLKTADVNVERVQAGQPDPTKLPEVLGYRVTNSFSVLVQDKDAVKLSQNAGRVLDTAMENGANFVQRMVAFRHDDAEVKREGLTKAVEDALANARAIAEGAKVQITGTFSLNGEPVYYLGQGQCGLTTSIPTGGGEAAGDTPVIVGDLEVTVRVNVTCTY